MKRSSGHLRLDGKEKETERAVWSASAAVTETCLCGCVRTCTSANLHAWDGFLREVHEYCMTELSLPRALECK